jgi:hypothetical protein
MGRLFLKGIWSFDIDTQANFGCLFQSRVISANTVFKVSNYCIHRECKNLAFPPNSKYSYISNSKGRSRIELEFQEQNTTFFIICNAVKLDELKI